LTVEPTPSRAHQLGNQILGLLIFLVGVALLVLVFYWVVLLYQSINGAMFGVQATTAPNLPAGSVKATPGTGLPILPALGLIAAKLLALMTLGWLASMVAARGAQLAVGHHS
jgi:hypothetical protein